jgi:prepilin-type processing-associated H-X9-DG protein
MFGRYDTDGYRTLDSLTQKFSESMMYMDAQIDGPTSHNIFLTWHVNASPFLGYPNFIHGGGESLNVVYNDGHAGAITESEFVPQYTNTSLASFDRFWRGE